MLLGRYSRMEDIITLTTVANNLKRPDLEGVLGPFSNTVALRTDLSGMNCCTGTCALCAAIKVAKSYQLMSSSVA